MSFFDFKVFFCFDVLGVELQLGNRDEVTDLEWRVLDDGVNVAGRRADEGEGRVSGLPVVGRLVDRGWTLEGGVTDAGGRVREGAVPDEGGRVWEGGVPDEGGQVREGGVPDEGGWVRTAKHELAF